MKAFESLYYTDCLPGQGLRGGAGFQFQAVSSNVSHDMMALVQRSTLYEAPVSWMREHRPANDYPPSLAHAFDGCYVTARGVYLGAEANGVREGNQFTHAVATEDAETYGMVRPAQLWAAPWWSEQPAPSTECPAVAAEPDTGPWGIEAVREWILGRPDGEEWLTDVYSAVDRVHDSGRRILFVATDPAVVLCWLTAATLLLPQARALRVTFRVFATNPQYSEHDVLALHPDWAGRFARENGEFAVFNVDSGTRPPVEPTDAALRWVPRFLRDDPYDVIDAVELAHQLAQSGAAVAAHEARASTSDVLASCAVLFDQPATDARECENLTTWLAEHVTPLGEDVVAPVAAAILAGPVTVPVLRTLDAALHRHRQTGELAVRVRYALLGAEMAALVDGTPPGENRASLPPVPWPATEFEDVVESAADTVEPSRLPLLLRTARRFGVTPRPHAFRTGIHRFGEWWADHPAEPIEPDTLPCGQELVDQLRDELAHRLRGADVERAEDAIHQHLWRPLHRALLEPTRPLHLAEPLDSVVAAATVAQNPGARGPVLEKVVGATFRAPHDAVETAWRASFRFSPPSLAELAWFLTYLPPGEIPREIAKSCYEIVGKAVHVVSTSVLDVLEQLRERGATPPAGPLAKLTDDCRTLRRALAAVRNTRQHKDSPAVMDLRKMPPAVLTCRAEAVLDTLLGTTLKNAALVAEHGNVALRALLANRLPEIWANPKADDERRNTAVALAYLTATAPTCTPDTAARLVSALRDWFPSNQSRHIEVEQLLRDAAPESATKWREDLGSTPAASTKDSTATKRPRWWLGNRRE